MKSPGATTIATTFIAANQQDAHEDASTTAADINEFTTKNWWKLVLDYSNGIHNDSSEIDKAHLRTSMLNVYPLVILAYSALCLIGVLLNSILMWVIVRNRYFKDATYTYLLNMCVADIVKCVFVIPISLFNMLLQNWIFGAFLCYFLPMLQVIFNPRKNYSFR